MIKILTAILSVFVVLALGRLFDGCDASGSEPCAAWCAAEPCLP